MSPKINVVVNIVMFYNNIVLLFGQKGCQQSANNKNELMKKRKQVWNKISLYVKDADS